MLIVNLVLGAFNYDQYILDAFVNQLAGYRWFFFIITQLGSPLALAIAACLTFILGKNKLRVFAAILVIGLLFSVIVVDDVKDIVQRPRPAGAEAELLTQGSYSFPSGHALCIFLAAFTARGIFRVEIPYHRIFARLRREPEPAIFRRTLSIGRPGRGDIRHHFRRDAGFCRIQVRALR